MAPKRSKTSASNSSSKRQRKSIDLEVKQKVIKQHEGGKSVNAIARDLGMSHSTITTILKNKEKILQAVKGSAPLKATRLTKMREGPISDMERLLMTWIEDQTQKQIPLSTSTITAKARSLFEMLKEKAGPDYNIEFSASSGWFMRFKQRFSLHNVKLMETKSKKLSASENRKRNAVREESERILYGSLNTFLEKVDEIPEKKEKTSELQVSVDCSTGTSLIKKDVNVPSSSMSTIAGKFQEQLKEKKSEVSTIPVVLSADPGTWPRILNIKQWGTLIENDPPQVRNFNFPKDNTGRKFSETYYTRILPNGEKTTRSWLLYSTSKDSVFCLYCKLFGEGKNQLKNENGCRDWQHLSHILSKHEESEMHINNSVKYSKLKSDLKKNKTVEAAEQRLYKDEKNGDVLLLYT